MRSRLFAITLITCFVAAFAGASLDARAAGALQVTVYSQDAKQAKDLAPGAQVTLTSKSNLIPLKAALTDVDGLATFEAIPPGKDYVVEASFPGYAKLVKENVEVKEGQIAKVVMILLAEIVEETTVKGQRNVVDIETAGVGETKISAETFSDLPIAGREYQQALSLAAGVQDSDGDGNPVVHGSRERDFKADVDGVSNVDPLTGFSMSNVNPDSIEEIQIVESGADASYGGAIGGFARITTKSGGNQFEGTLNLFVQDKAFNNDGAGGSQPLELKVLQPSIFLAGPIVRDHVWYSLSHEYTTASQPNFVIGGQSFVQKFTGSQVLDKVTWQVNPKNKVQLQYSADPYEFSPANVNSITPKESGTRFEGGGPTYLAKWTAPWSPTFFWETTVAFSDLSFSRTPFDRKAKNNCSISGISPEGEPYDGYFCTDNRSLSNSGPFFADYSDSRQRWSYKLDAEQFVNEWLGGSHRLKTGFSFERTNYSRDLTQNPTLFIIQLGGTADPLNPSPRPDALVSFTQSYPRSKSTTARGNYYAIYISDQYDPLPNLSFTVGARIGREEITSDGFAPFDPAADRANLDAAMKACIDAGNLAQTCLKRHINLVTLQQTERWTPDACQSAPNLWHCGVLEEYYLSGREDELKRRSFETFTITNNTVSPRLFARWDPRNDGKTILAASWGRFYGDSILQPFVAEAGPDTTTQGIVLDQFGGDAGRAGFSAFTTNIIDRDIKPQRTDELTLSVEREIAPETSLRLRYVKRDYRDLWQDTDVNHRPVYWDEIEYLVPRVFPNNAAQILTNCRKIGDFADCIGAKTVDAFRRTNDVPDGIPDLQVVSPGFNAIYKITNANEADYKAYIIEINRRFYQNWEATASYTWSKSFGQAEDFNLALGDDPTNTDDERGPLSTDQRHVFKANGRVFVPNWWGGVRVGGFMTWESGLPYSLIEQRVVLDFPGDLTGGGGVRAQNPPVFLTPRTTYPTGQRNDRRNPSQWTFNVNFQKEFQLRNVKATAQVDVFNLLNDNTSRIFALQRFVQVDYLPDGTLSQRVVDRPISARRFGRYFQVALKLNI